MKDFDSLLNIWNEQQTSHQVNYKEVIAQHQQTKSSFAKKIRYELILISIVTVLLGFFWLKTDFNFWTTHLSLIIIEVCCINYVYFQIKNLKTLSNDTLLEKPEKYISYLEAFQKNRQQQNHRNFYFYGLSITLALCLYFIELFKFLNLITIIAIIIFCIIWGIVSILYFRKNYIKKEEEVFKKMLEELNRLKNQFSN